MTKSKSQMRQGGGNAARKKKRINLVFDPDARKEFLSGFHKRKLQKKAFYKTKLEKKMAEEKQRIRAQARNASMGRSSSHSILPEVEALLAAENPSLLSTESFDIGSKTVTITSLDSIHQPVAENDDEFDGNDVELPLESDDKKVSANTNSSIKQSTNRLLQNSAIFKKVQRLKQKSKKSRTKPNPHFTSVKDKNEGKVTTATKGKKVSKRREQKSIRKQAQKISKKKGKKGK